MIYCATVLVRGHLNTRGHILEVTERLLADRESIKLRVVDVAKAADVGVQTIYYHFGSRRRLIAEAQALTYLRLVEPLHEFLSRAESALIEQDEQTFVNAVSDNMALAWSYGQGDDLWKIPKLLIDIWADPKTQQEFVESLNTQLQRWADTLDRSKALGWMDEESDPLALVVSFWAASIGQSIFTSSVRFSHTTDRLLAFYLHAGQVGRSER